MKKTNLLMSTVASIALVSVASPAMAGDVYGPYPITLKGYSGDKLTLFRIPARSDANFFTTA